MKKSLLIAAAALTATVSFAGHNTRDNAGTTDTDVILHAWSWSFDTIAANMKQIADAGYTYVQTSPANTCYVGEGGGPALFSQPGDEVTGKWYYYYQPIDWKVGNHMLGSRDRFKAMCDSAYKYGVKVIVDVLPNHTAIDTTAVSTSLRQAVGGMENLYHANGFTPITDYNDRLQCTTGQMGGLHDVNTENPDFQYYYMQYVNDLINLGARGFRYDTAKHIGLPSDPLDPKAKVNNFWEIFAAARQGAKGLSMLMPDSLYIYGEVLQDRNVKENEYAAYMDVTASAYGHELRRALEAGNVDSVDIRDWHHTATPNRLVTWVESHDTYCNAHESAHLDDDAIRMGWVILTARDAGTPLFFSRPAGSSRDNYWGTNRIGNRGNDEFFHPEVVAVNKFRAAMNGEKELILTNDKGNVVQVARGNKGAALVNLSDRPVKLSIDTPLPDGNYTDRVHNTPFKVKDGRMTARLQPHTAYIIY